MNESVDRYWTAFYTKPRNEKRVSERLGLSGYEVYCPVRTTLKQWSDRKKKVKEVLFTSYIFAYVNETERQHILYDQGIVSSVFWLKKPVRILEEEIDAIRAFIEDHPNAEVVPNSFREGQVVKIKDGPFEGEIGEISREGTRKAVLVLKSLGISIQAELSKNSLELVK